MTVYEKNFLLFLFVEETIVFCGIGTGGIQYFLTVIAKSNLLRVYSGSLSLDKLCTRQGQQAPLYPQGGTAVSTQSLRHLI